MKKKLLALLVAFLAAAGAQANTYSDNNPADVWITVLSPSYTGTFTLAGYNPLNETVASGYAEFTFWDLLGSESLKVDMGGDFLTHGSFTGTLTLGTNVLNAWGALDSTGVLSYTVSRTSGGLSEFWLKNAFLSVTTESRNVPDAGASSMLVGIGLIAMLAMKRRLASSV